VIMYFFFQDHFNKIWWLNKVNEHIFVNPSSINYLFHFITLVWFFYFCSKKWILESLNCRLSILINNCCSRNFLINLFIKWYIFQLFKNSSYYLSKAEFLLFCKCITFADCYLTYGSVRYIDISVLYIVIMMNSINKLIYHLAIRYRL
jgi:hypothetical protein